MYTVSMVTHMLFTLFEDLQKQIEQVFMAHRKSSLLLTLKGRTSCVVIHKILMAFLRISHLPAWWQRSLFHNATSQSKHKYQPHPPWLTSLRNTWILPLCCSTLVVHKIWFTVRQMSHFYNTSISYNTMCTII